jgi:cell division protein FtsL
MQATETVTHDRRYIYNGDTPPTTSGYAVRPNRRGTQRKISTFNVILLLFAIGIASVLYVNSILTVNQLVYEVDQLDRRLKEIAVTNQQLKAEVSLKAARERIGAYAKDQLGMRDAVEPPTLIDVDGSQLDKMK